jgi:ribosomal subunit interface protein
MVDRAYTNSGVGRELDRGIGFKAFFKHMDYSEALAQYAERKLVDCAQTYLRRGGTIQVTFAIEGNRHVIQVHLTGSVDVALKAEAREGESMYACVDHAQDKLDETLRRRKEKWTDHHGEGHWQELERLERGERLAREVGGEPESSSSIDDAIDAAYVLHYERVKASGSGSSME